jgi:hypothetical protein
MKTISTLAAAAMALSLGFAGPAAAETTTEIGPQVSTDSNIANAGYYWYYRQGWRGRCFYRYLYVTNGYRYAYRWKRTCY